MTFDLDAWMREKEVRLIDFHSNGINYIADVAEDTVGYRGETPLEACQNLARAKGWDVPGEANQSDAETIRLVKAMVHPAATATADAPPPRAVRAGMTVYVDNARNLLSRLWRWIMQSDDDYIRERQEWIERWDAACLKCWTKLCDGPHTKQNFEWFARNHNRLMKLIERKK